MTNLIKEFFVSMYNMEVQNLKWCRTHWKGYILLIVFLSIPSLLYAYRYEIDNVIIETKSRLKSRKEES